MSSTSNTLPNFSPTSTYGQDLQQVLARAVSIASLPLQQDQALLTQLQNQSDAVSGLNTTFSGLQSAISQLDLSSTATAPTVSDPKVAAVVGGTNTLPGTYSLNVISPGAPTTAVSLDGLTTVSDPSSQSLSTATSFTLSVNGSSFTINPASNSLNALAAAINNSSAGVSATIINVGGPSSPDYRLSLQTDNLGAIPIQLNDGSQDVLQILVSGSTAQYQINGLPAAPISSNTSIITIAPGLTANLLQAGATTVVVAQTSSALVTALSSYVAAYNATVDAIAAQHGTQGGALSGNPVLATLTQTLRTLNTYAGSTTTVKSLADLGLNLDKTGHITLDQTQLSTALSTSQADVAAFLGSSTTGGFLQAASNALNAVTDTSTGVLADLQTQYQASIKAENQTILDAQNKINLMQASLTAKLSAADALITSLQSQSTFFTNLFETMNANAKSNN